MREVDLVEAWPDLLAAAIEAQLDTAKTIRLLGSPYAYMGCCLLALRFDTTPMRYAEYLEGMREIAQEGRSRRVTRTRNVRLAQWAW